MLNLWICIPGLLLTGIWWSVIMLAVYPNMKNRPAQFGSILIATMPLITFILGVSSWKGGV